MLFCNDNFLFIFIQLLGTFQNLFFFVHFNDEPEKIKMTIHMLKFTSLRKLKQMIKKPRDRRYNESEMTNCEASLLIDHPSYKAIFCYYRRGAR